jgi:hypothetical protein
MYLLFDSLKWGLKILGSLIWDIRKINTTWLRLYDECRHIFLILKIWFDMPLCLFVLKSRFLSYTVFPIKAFSKDIIFHLDCKDMAERAHSFTECAGKFC